MSPQERKGRNVAHQRAARAAARAAQQRKQRRVRAIVAAIIGAVVVLALVLTMLPNNGDDTNTASSTTSTTATTLAPDQVGDVIRDDPSENTSPPFEYGTGECAPDEKPAEKPTSFAAAPKSCLQDGVDYSAVVTTSQGEFTIDLLEHRSPGTVNNFVQLAKWGWYDDITFHRVVKGFVDQTGDPFGNPPGTGGPGYTIADELPPAVQSYQRGAIAMANSGPNTNGSQWFACVDCSILPTPGYSLFGQVTDGMEVVQAINDLAIQGDVTDPPVTITSIEIVEG
jgi:cyclophilin family peptidyl-prolyl cis-trans isomerase